ncbi:hypothetical protein ACQ5SO_19095 [Rhodovulum sp. DZ06]|uniref:hypothetical protein n=1 Tax=Rhodovulum sp. DZ06 TaxID=3425126 RepID=UPI003D335432
MPLPLTDAVMAAVFFTIAPGVGVLGPKEEGVLSALTNPQSQTLFERGRASIDQGRSGNPMLR